MNVAAQLGVHGDWDVIMEDVQRQAVTAKKAGFATTQIAQGEWELIVMIILTAILD